MKYENTARYPVYAAAKLLDFDTSEMDKAKFTYDYTEYFKQKSIISIFLLNSIDAFRFEEIGLNNNLPDPVIKNLIDINY